MYLPLLFLSSLVALSRALTAETAPILDFSALGTSSWTGKDVVVFFLDFLFASLSILALGSIGLEVPPRPSLRLLFLVQDGSSKLSSSSPSSSSPSMMSWSSSSSMKSVMILDSLRSRFIRACRRWWSLKLILDAKDSSQSLQK